MKIVLIINSGYASNATEEDGPYSDTCIRDKGKVWDLISPLLHVTDEWPHMKTTRKNCDGKKVMLAFFDHFGGPNNVDHLQKQEEMNLQNLTYKGEKKKWNFQRFVTDNKDKHTTLEGLNKHDYNGLDNRIKVKRLMDGVKVDSFNAVKEMIIANSDFHKYFDSCVTLYKGLLRKSDSTQSETRRVL